MARLPGPGTKRLLKPGLLGHEWDEDLDNGHRPPGLVRLSETAVDNLWMIQDYGANYDSGSATHHLVMYRSVAGSKLSVSLRICSSSCLIRSSCCSRSRVVLCCCP